MPIRKFNYEALKDIDKLHIEVLRLHGQLDVAGCKYDNYVWDVSTADFRVLSQTIGHRSSKRFSRELERFIVRRAVEKNSVYDEYAWARGSYPEIPAERCEYIHTKVLDTLKSLRAGSPLGAGIFRTNMGWRHAASTALLGYMVDKVAGSATKEKRLESAWSGTSVLTDTITGLMQHTYAIRHRIVSGSAPHDETIDALRNYKGFARRDAFPPLDLPLDEFSTTALMWAAMTDNAELVNRLASAGASLDLCDATGATALELAVRSRCLKSFEALLQNESPTTIGQPDETVTLLCELSQSDTSGIHEQMIDLMRHYHPEAVLEYSIFTPSL